MQFPAVLRTLAAGCRVSRSKSVPSHRQRFPGVFCRWHSCVGRNLIDAAADAEVRAGSGAALAALALLVDALTHWAASSSCPGHHRCIFQGGKEALDAPLLEATAYPSKLPAMPPALAFPLSGLEERDLRAVLGRIESSPIEEWHAVAATCRVAAGLMPHVASPRTRQALRALLWAAERASVQLSLSQDEPQLFNHMVDVIESASIAGCRLTRGFAVLQPCLEESVATMHPRLALRALNAQVAVGLADTPLVAAIINHHVDGKVCALSIQDAALFAQAVAVGNLWDTHGHAAEECLWHAARMLEAHPEGLNRAAKSLSRQTVLALVTGFLARNHCAQKDRSACSGVPAQHAAAFSALQKAAHLLERSRAQQWHTGGSPEGWTSQPPSWLGEVHTRFLSLTHFAQRGARFMHFDASRRVPFCQHLYFPDLAMFLQCYGPQHFLFAPPAARTPASHESTSEGEHMRGLRPVVQLHSSIVSSACPELKEAPMSYVDWSAARRSGQDADEVLLRTLGALP